MVSFEDVMRRLVLSRPLWRRLGAAAAIAGLAAAAGCGEPLQNGSPHGAAHDSSRDRAEHLRERGDGRLHAVTLDGPAEVDRTFSEGRASFEPPGRVRQVSLMYDAPEGTELEWRALYEDGAPGRWRPVEVTWAEENSHVARALLDAPAPRIELRTSGPLQSAYVEFSGHVTARTAGPLTRDLPRAGTGDRPGVFRTTRQRQAPRSLVIPREEWGARNPEKVCGSPHTPSRTTIHHTASPDSDGDDPAARLREMQAFHIDNRGWCDIGYHFVVSQSGNIYQGRSTEKRTGAHVGGENANNVGVAHIGNFEEQTVRDAQFEASTRIVHWIHETYEIPLDREHTKGHTQWPGQTTDCPGTNMLSRLEELRRRSENPEGASDPPWDVRVQASVIGARILYTQGSSSGVADALPGDSLRAEIVVTNNSTDPVDEVSLGYSVPTPYLEAIGYTIFTDHPEHDRESWEADETNSSAENPERLGSEGAIELSALSPGESKRVVVRLGAKTYSLGSVDHAELRGWVRRIPEIYETKDGWSDEASTNRVGRELRAAAEVDVPSRDEWQFEDTSDPKNLEGWTGCCSDDYGELAVNEQAGAMAMKVTGPDPTLESPDWTRIDASTFDRMILRFRSHDGPHPVAVDWHRRGETFDAGRTMRFEAPGDGQFHTLAVPLGEDSRWSGTVRGLRIHPLDSGEAPDEEATRWYDVDKIYFQSTASGETTAAREAFRGATTVEPLGSTGAGADDGRNRRGGSTVRARSSGDDVRVKGCASTGAALPPAPAGLLAGFGLVLLAARRTRISRRRGRPR